VFGWLRRLRTLAGAREAVDGEVDRLYARASDAWLGGRLSEAERCARRARALSPELPALNYLLGSVLLDRGDHPGALAALEACLERRPAYPLAQHARAKWALCRSRAAPYYPALEQLRGTAPRVSVIICSIVPAKFERISANYVDLLAGVPHEIIGIHDARSLAEGYNRGIGKARGEILVFSHDDIEIVTPDFAAKLANRLAESDLIGIAGTDRVCGGSWIDAGWPHVFGQVGLPVPNGVIASTYILRGASAAPMQALDGVFFACRRAVVDKIVFDERTFDGWHLYDLDFTYSAALAGFRISIGSDLLVMHQSGGNFGEAWRGYARKFMAKHLMEAPQDYAFKKLEFAAVLMSSVQEWRSFTHYMTASDL
jgi:hypothetical protein